MPWGTRLGMPGSVDTCNLTVASTREPRVSVDSLPARDPQEYGSPGQAPAYKTTAITILIILKPVSTSRQGSHAFPLRDTAVWERQILKEF